MPPTAIGTNRNHQALQDPWPSYAGTPLAAGDHICALYRGQEQRDALLEEYLVGGLKAGQKCLFITPRGESEGLMTTVTSQVSNEQAARFTIEDTSKQYLKDGAFSGASIMSFWEGFAEEAYVLEHHDYARAACEVTWIADLSADELEHFVQYEKEVTAFCRAHPQVALCLYDISRLPASVILTILKIHAKVLFSRIVVENPYSLLE